MPGLFPVRLGRPIPWVAMGPSTDESRRMQALRELRTRKPGSLLIRADFSDEQAWIDIRRRATAPVLVTGGDEFLADLRVIDDPQFEGLEAAELAAAGADWSLGHVAFLVDDTALIRPYPIVAVELTTGEEELVFVTSQASLLHFPASDVRPQGRGGGGVAGVRLTDGAQVVFFGAVDLNYDNIVVTVSGSSAALPGTDPGSWKVTPFDEYPGKGRATGGVRAHRFLKGEDALTTAWVGRSGARAAQPNGVAITLPEAEGRRDGSGTPATAVIGGIGSL